MVPKSNGLLPIVWFLAEGNWTPALFVDPLKNPHLVSLSKMFCDHLPGFPEQLSVWMSERGITDLGFWLALLPQVSCG